MNTDKKYRPTKSLCSIKEAAIYLGRSVDYSKTKAEADAAETAECH